MKLMKPDIAMEFLEGENLQKIIADRRGLPIVRKLQIIIDTCKGIDYAHQHGVVHRDVKPGNIVRSKLSISASHESAFPR
jgi:serine/threonine-protein kinase